MGFRNQPQSDRQDDQSDRQQGNGGNRPAETLVMPSNKGRVEVAIWERVDGDRVSYSATLQRTYFDATEKKWKRTNSLFPGDLLPAALLLQRAAEAIANQQLKK